MKLSKTFANFMRKHGSTVLAVAASIGVGVTAYEASKATAWVTSDAEEWFIPSKKENTKIELAQTYWKHYIPAAIAGAGTVACIMCANALSKKQIANLTAAYVALGKSYQQMRTSIGSRCTPETHEAIIQDIANDTQKQQEAEKSDEKLLCYEPISKRYFHATAAELMDAFYEMNRDFALTGEVPLNNLYAYLPELDFTPEGDKWGWNYDYMADAWEYYWIDFRYEKRTTDDGREYYYITADQEPIKDFTEDYYETYCKQD